MPIIERRHTPGPGARVRIERQTEDGPAKIIGYAAVFYREGEAGTEYELWPGLVERIMPGAFDRALREKDDVRALFNHDSNNLLGRTGPGTLRLAIDQVGLRYEIDVPDTQTAREVVEAIERGDLSGSSFSFLPERIVWIEEGDLDIRQVEGVKLFDVGPVTFPAFEGTTADVRHVEGTDLDAVIVERKQWKRHRRAVAVRARMVEVESQKDD